MYAFVPSVLATMLFIVFSGYGFSTANKYSDAAVVALFDPVQAVIVVSDEPVPHQLKMSMF